MTLAKQIINDQTGATAIEYGLMIAALSIPTMLIMRQLGFWMDNRFANLLLDLHDANYLG